MNLNEFINKVAKNKDIKNLGIRKYEMKVIVSVVFEELLLCLLQYKKVSLYNFFTINLKKFKGKNFKNINTGEMEMSPDYHKVSITPAKWFDEELKNIDESGDLDEH